MMNEWIQDAGGMQANGHLYWVYNDPIDMIVFGALGLLSRLDNIHDVS